jgi:protocatechuate 3,4-dioxygenase beta subunit
MKKTESKEDPKGFRKPLGSGRPTYLSVGALGSLFLLFLLAACSGQPAATTVSQPAATAQPTAQAQIPNTGVSTAAPTLPSLPTSGPSASTQATAPAATASGTSATPALSCIAPAAQTPAVTEGPFFKAGSPETTSLLTPGMAGTKLVLSGYVLNSACQPVAHALLDFWQANSQGVYDNSGYTLRGHQFTDANGHYQLETIIPGLYPGRTEHIHVKVQASGGPVLTTQLFFPGVIDNTADGIFNPKLLVSLQDAPDGKLASFNFVISQP